MRGYPVVDKLLVSVCISVYNGEACLRRCLDSVVSQKISSMELVLVNDGSVDHTAQIMAEYRDRFPDLRIRIIEQENRGLAQGRLTGVKNSSGEYVTFLDADDYLLPGAYQAVLRFMEHTQADIYEFRTIREGYYSRSPYSGVMNTKQVLTDYFNGVHIPVNYWLRWWKRSLFTEELFPQGISLHEDVYAFPCLLHRADTIAYLEEPLHVHMKNETSLMSELYAQKKTREYFEKQKILLGSIPHIVSNIGRDEIERAYKKPFAHYVARTLRNFMMIDAEGVSYDEKLDAILTVLNLQMSRKDLERYITRNVSPVGKFNRLIRLLGLHNAYRIHRILR